MRQILGWKFGGTAEQAMEALDGFDEKVQEHDRLCEPGDEVPDRTKVSLVFSAAPEPLRTHLHLRAGARDSYRDLRKTIRRGVASSTFCCEHWGK